MAYSRVRYVHTQGGPTTFSYAAIQMLGAGADTENEQLNVYFNDMLLTETTHYTVNTTNNTITLTSVIANALVVGSVIALERDTKKDDRYVDWTNNAGIDEADLDLEGDQLLFIAQEAIDEASTALRKNNAQTKWDGEGLPSYNCAPAVDGNGWVTLDQVSNLISGADTAVVGTTNTWCFDGNGSTTGFFLSGASDPTTANNLFVTVDGVTLCPCDSDIPIGDYVERASVALYPRITTYAASLVSNRQGWIDALNGQKTEVDNILGTSYPGVVVFYEVKVNSSSGSPAAPPTVPSTFIGTYSQCLAYINTWTDDGINDTYLGDIRYHKVEGTETGYTYNNSTKTLTITPAPYVGASICVRQLTGTVAVNLADLSLDGTELMDNSIKSRHLNVLNDPFFLNDTRALSTNWPMDSNKILIFTAVTGEPKLDLIDSSYILNFNTSVQANRLNQMTVPNASVSMNNQKITNLLTGTLNTDAVNLGQVSTLITSGTTGITDRLKYNAGVAPDLYYNNYSNDRLDVAANYQYDGVNPTGARLVKYLEPEDNCVLFRGFKPRWIRIELTGYGKKVTYTNGTQTVSSVTRVDGSGKFKWVWEEVLGENENGHTAYTESVVGGITRRVYTLTAAKRFEYSSNTSTLNNPSGFDGNEVLLTVEVDNPAGNRTWLKIKDTNTDNAGWFIISDNNTEDNTTGVTPGSIQVVAMKGM